MTAFHSIHIFRGKKVYLCSCVNFELYFFSNRSHLQNTNTCLGCFLRCRGYRINKELRITIIAMFNNVYFLRFSNLCEIIQFLTIVPFLTICWLVVERVMPIPITFSTFFAACLIPTFALCSIAAFQTYTSVWVFFSLRCPISIALAKVSFAPSLISFSRTFRKFVPKAISDHFGRVFKAHSFAKI